MGIIEESQRHFYNKTKNYRTGCITTFILILLAIVGILCSGCNKDALEPLQCNCGESGLSFRTDTRYYVIVENECSETLKLVELDSVQFETIKFGDEICQNESW